MRRLWHCEVKSASLELWCFKASLNPEVSIADITRSTNESTGHEFSRKILDSGKIPYLHVAAKAESLTFAFQALSATEAIRVRCEITMTTAARTRHESSELSLHGIRFSDNSVSQHRLLSR
jgi:hypothetical protein